MALNLALSTSRNPNMGQKGSSFSTHRCPQLGEADQSVIAEVAKILAVAFRQNYEVNE